MDVRDYFCISHGFLEQGVQEIFDALDQEELAWRPGPGLNSAGFILWHIVRMEDEYFHGLVLKRPTVWRGGGWYQRFGQHPSDTGTAFSDDEVADFQIPPKDDFLAYMRQVWNTTMESVKNLQLESLDQPASPDLTPRSLAEVLASNITRHGTLHLGEARYLVGILGKQYRPLSVENVARRIIGRPLA